MIYFIQSGQYVKIGYTSNLKSRFKKYVTENPQQVKLLGFCKGGYDVEKKIHKQFSKYRDNREWFTFNEDVRLLIKEIIKENKDNEEPVERSMKKSTLHLEIHEYLKRYKTIDGYLDISPELRVELSKEFDCKLSKLTEYFKKLETLQLLVRTGALYIFP